DAAGMGPKSHGRRRALCAIALCVTVLVLPHDKRKRTEERKRPLMPQSPARRRWMRLRGAVAPVFALAAVGLPEAQAFVGQWLASFKECPPRQKPASFSVDQVMEKLTSAPAGGHQ